MVNPSSSSLRSCSSSKKRKRQSKTETLTEVEESSSSLLLRPCSTDERRESSITADVEEDKEKQNIDGDGDGACKMIRDGCDFLCAEELGKQFLLCGGRYHRYHSNSNTKKKKKNQNSEVSIKKVVHKKSVGILFSNLTSSNELYFLRPLIDVYYQLTQQRGAAFEIVFVPYFPNCNKDIETDDERKDRFNAHLKQMPWLSVPFDDDKNWRKHLLKRYKQESSGCNNALILFGPNGRRCQEHCCDGFEKLVHLFGPDFHPFTKAKEKELIHKYFAPLRSPNKLLEALLGAPGRDFLISSSLDGDDYKKVPISQLQGKVVGIYFFFQEDEKHQNRDFMRKLEDFRLRASSERGSTFEIVFINVDFEFGYSSETSFRRFLKKWPWLLALPFKDDKIRDLCYTLAIGDCVNPLTIVGGGTGGDEFFIDPQGYSIIQEYGFDAYPFTRDMAIVTAKKRLTELKLADFFKATRTEFLSRCKGKPEKPVSFLQNKRVLLYIASSRSHREIKKLLDLQKKDKSFTVLFFAPERRIASTIKNMPKKWVAFPPGIYLWKLIDKTVKVNILYGNYFIAFDDTGKLIKMGGMKLLKKKEGAAPAFSFITDETFDNEFRQMMIYTKKWNYEVGEWN